MAVDAPPARIVSPDAEAAPAAQPVAAAGVAGLPVRSGNAGGVAPWHGRPAAPGNTIEHRRRFPLAWLSFLAIVVLPVATAGIYYFLIAADQYVTEFRLALRSVEPAQRRHDTLFQVSAAPARIGLDSYIVVQYIASRAIVDDLGRTLDLRAMFSTDKADWPARLHLPVSVEELVAYWKGQVDAFFDATNGTIVVRASAFTAPDALRLAQGILGSSERLINQLSARARRDALRSSESEVHLAEQRLAAALTHLRDFRDRQGLIDPHKTADATAVRAGEIRDELVRADTELSTLKHYMQDSAPTVEVLKSRIRSLEEQRRSIEGEVTETEKTRSAALSRVMGAYEELEGERRFAENAYQHALEALDRARIDADRQQIYIADFVPPSLPEEALYPRRLRSLAIVASIAFAVWAIGGLIVRSVRDHL